MAPAKLPQAFCFVLWEVFEMDAPTGLKVCSHQQEHAAQQGAADRPKGP